VVSQHLLGVAGDDVEPGFDQDECDSPTCRPARPGWSARSACSRRSTAGRTALAEALRTGEGVGWQEHDPALFEGVARFFRPGYAAVLVSEWLPALDG
jgi:hypothetical protein